MGLQENNIEVFDTPQTLRGYGGTAHSKKAEIRVKGVGNYNSDLGFEKQTDGTYTLHVDTDGRKFGQQWQGELQQRYACEVIKEVASERNFFVASEEERDGEFFVKVTSPF